MRSISLVVLIVAALLGCDRASSSDQADQTAVPAGVVDSALPIDTLLARFRATVSDTPTSLVGGEPSAERLTRALLAALASNDTVAIRRLVLSRAEFAWLYYPHTKFTKPPYELGPELLWMQMGAASEKGAVRLLRRYGGMRLRFEALDCPDSTVTEGPNRITGSCQVRFAAADSAARTLRMFGSVIQRDGAFKFVSYANEL